MMDRGKLVKALYLGANPVTLAYKGSDPVTNPSPTPPFPAPAGTQWPSQVNPNSYNRDVEMLWGQRWAGADPTVQDKAKWVLTLDRNNYALSTVDNNEIIIEVRNGDRYGHPVKEGGWEDPATSERSEIQNAELVPTGWNWNLGWKSLIEGPSSTPPWNNLFQTFARNNGAGMGSPPVSLSLEPGDQLKLITRHGSGPTETYRHSFNFPRNTWVEFWLEGRWSTTGDGFCRLYINDATAIEAENINLGYSGQTHWEIAMGVYRRSATETLRHHMKDYVQSW